MPILGSQTITSPTGASNTSSNHLVFNLSITIPYRYLPIWHDMIWHIVPVRFVGLASGGSIDWTQLSRSKWPLVAALGAGCLVGASGLFLVQVSYQLLRELFTTPREVTMVPFHSVYRGALSWRHRRGPCRKNSPNSTPPSAPCRSRSERLRRLS